MNRFRDYVLGPVWVKQPQVLQLDCYRFCNLKCDYCNVAPGKAFGLAPGAMADGVYLQALKNFEGNDGIVRVYQFMNGEPMLDPKLLWRVEMAKSIVGCRSQIITNGSVLENKSVLSHPDLDVRITVSAVDPSVYYSVMGVDCYDKVMDVVEYAKKCVRGNLEFNFVKTPLNQDNVRDWLIKYLSYRRAVFPVHLGKGQVASERNYMPGPILDYEPRSLYGFKRGYGSLPCNCWDNMSIGKDGEFMLCCDTSPKHNFGNVMKDDWRIVWRERNKQGLDNGICVDCSYRRKDAVDYQKQVWDRFGS